MSINPSIAVSNNGCSYYGFSRKDILDTFITVPLNPRSLDN